MIWKEIKYTWLNRTTNFLMLSNGYGLHERHCTFKTISKSSILFIQTEVQINLTFVLRKKLHWVNKKARLIYKIPNFCKKANISAKCDFKALKFVSSLFSNLY